MSFDYTVVSNICSSNQRLPLEIRTNKTIAKQFIDFIKKNSIFVKNEFIPILSNWCEGNDDLKFSKIISIDYIGKNQTFDMEVENGHSYKANGIFAHNTYNLPETATEEDVEAIFLEAWKSGCKGLTVYRDKCRSGVLVNHSSSEENKIDIFKENHAPKRGKSLSCDIIRFSNKGEKWIGFLGLLDNKPYEVFTGPQDMVPIPSSITSGEIVKDKALDGSKNIYNLRWVDKDGFVQEFKGLSRAFNREYWNIGRLVSGILRHGMPLQNVITLIDSLEIDGGESLTNWKNGVKRMLKKYIADGTKIKGEICPECGSPNIIFKEGCLGCSDCGWSRCG